MKYPKYILNRDSNFKEIFSASDGANMSHVLNEPLGAILCDKLMDNILLPIKVGDESCRNIKISQLIELYSASKSKVQSDFLTQKVLNWQEKLEKTGKDDSELASMKKYGLEVLCILLLKCDLDGVNAISDVLSKNYS